MHARCGGPLADRGPAVSGPTPPPGPGTLAGAAASPLLVRNESRLALRATTRRDHRRLLPVPQGSACRSFSTAATPTLRCSSRWTNVISSAADAPRRSSRLAIRTDATAAARRSIKLRDAAPIKRLFHLRLAFTPLLPQLEPQPFAVTLDQLSAVSSRASPVAGSPSPQTLPWPSAHIRLPGPRAAYQQRDHPVCGVAGGATTFFRRRIQSGPPRHGEAPRDRLGIEGDIHAYQTPVVLLQRSSTLASPPVSPDSRPSSPPLRSGLAYVDAFKRVKEPRPQLALRAVGFMARMMSIRSSPSWRHARSMFLRWARSRAVQRLHGRHCVAQRGDSPATAAAATLARTILYTTDQRRFGLDGHCEATSLGMTVKQLLQSRLP